MTKKEDTYTRPGLRERLKEEIGASDKGGRPGKGLARRSQLLTKEYEKVGGDYKGEKTEAQKSLEKWTEEEWTTRTTSRPAATTRRSATCPKGLGRS